MRISSAMAFWLSGSALLVCCETDWGPEISGRVRSGEEGLSGVTVTLTQKGTKNRVATRTDADGSYAFDGDREGAYLITAAMKGYALTPGSIAVEAHGDDAGGNDFEAYPLPELVLPEGMPFFDNANIEIDPTGIEKLAAVYFGERGADADELEFIGGYLPLATADLLCRTSPDKAALNRYMGNMYLSGYYGGVWLRDVLFNNPAGPQPSDIINQLLGQMMDIMPAVLTALMSRGGDRAVFQGVAGAVGAPIGIALNGTDGDIFGANRASVDILLMIYGYDYGYYNFLIDNPPNGVEAPPDPLSCNQFMDCRMKSIELLTLNQYKPVLKSLFNADCTDPENRWCVMKGSMNQVGKGAVASGNLVWENIMSGNQMLDPAYLPLIDLSARFMLVSELTLLPTMKGWAEQDAAAGKCGLLQESAMLAWLGSYVSGLSSSLPEGTFPEVVMP